MFFPNASREKVFFNAKTIIAIYALVAIVIGIQQYSLGKYNNFTIFQNAVYHFFSHQNPYLKYPDIYYDVFLYNPSFLILFIPFAYLPIALGIPIWTLSIAMIYYFGISSLNFSRKQKYLLLYLIIPELITSLGNLQSNPVLAAFIVLAMVYTEKNRQLKSSFFAAINFLSRVMLVLPTSFCCLKSLTSKTTSQPLQLLLSFSLCPYFSIHLQNSSHCMSSGLIPCDRITL